MVRKISAVLGVLPAILLDLQGPTIRLGRFHGGAALQRSARASQSRRGASLVLLRSHLPAKLWRRIVLGDRIFVADGSVELRALKIKLRRLREVTHGCFPKLTQAVCGRSFEGQATLLEMAIPEG
jgi:pyruvate kinase